MRLLREQKNGKTIAGTKERDYCRRRMRLLQEQKNGKIIAGTEERDY